MLDELKELWRFRELLLTMVERELRVRYKNSALGFLWSFIIPLTTMAVLTFVFGYLQDNGMRSFSAYILAAYLPYLFFQQSIMDSSQSVLQYMPLVKKIYFPREILPLAVILGNFIHLLFGFVVFFVYLLVVWLINRGESPFQATTVLLPVLFFISFILSTGIGLFVAALNTFYEDVKYLTSVALYLLFFLSPITYMSEQVAYSRINIKSGGLIYNVYNLNPIAVLSTAYRQILLAPQGIPVNGVKQVPIMLDPKYLVWTFFLGLATLFGGYHLFNRMKWRFVERP
jgi:ABC-2 type transport system permease protein